MTASRPTEVYWRAGFWISFIAILAFFLVASMVSVDWGNTPIPLSEVMDSLDSSNVKLRGNWLFIFAAAGCCAVLYTLLRWWHLRLQTMIAGMLIPCFVIGPMAFAAMLLAPLLLFSASTGRADGEFYLEEMPQFAAVGFWMLLCFVFAAHEVWGRLKARTRAYSVQ